MTIHTGMHVRSGIAVSFGLILVAAIAHATSSEPQRSAPLTADSTTRSIWPPPDDAGPCAVTKTSNVAVPMRDGTLLRADIYRPDTTQQVPVILYRTQYDKEAAQVQPSRYQTPAWFASHCYIVVTQDIRGQYASAGRFEEFAHDQTDGYDSVEWAAALKGSSGRVGMYGSSYVGATQWLAAESLPPHLITIIPANTSSDYFNDWTYEDGAFRLNFIDPWALQDIVLSAAQNRGDSALVRQLQRDGEDLALWMKFTPYDEFTPFHPTEPKVAGYFFDWLRHPTYDSYWQRWAPQEYYRKLSIPVLNIEGWYDAFLPGGLQNFVGMSTQAKSVFARNNQRIVIGPWDHIGWGRPGSVEAPMLKQIGPVGNSPINELMLAWWDHYLKGKGNGVAPGLQVTYFNMGSNTWKTAASWPIPGTQYRNYYLYSDGHANSVLGDGRLVTTRPTSGQSPDQYDYDPRNPVPSVGGHSCCAAPSGSQGPYDQQSIEQRPDVLVYSAAPFDRQTEVTGPMSVTLYARSSAPDTDWTAKVVVVRKDGTAMNLNNGIIRASYRTSLSRPTPIARGRLYKYTITVWPTSYTFQPGDAVRLEVSSSDYPQFDPNPNTGRTLATSERMQVAHQTIVHDAVHPSYLTLPVVPLKAGTNTFPIGP